MISEKYVDQVHFCYFWKLWNFWAQLVLYGSYYQIQTNRQWKIHRESNSTQITHPFFLWNLTPVGAAHHGWRPHQFSDADKINPEDSQSTASQVCFIHSGKLADSRTSFFWQSVILKKQSASFCTSWSIFGTSTYSRRQASPSRKHLYMFKPICTTVFSNKNLVAILLFWFSLPKFWPGNHKWTIWRLIFPKLFVDRNLHYINLPKITFANSYPNLISLY